MKNKLFAIAAATTLFANATPVFATTLISSPDSINIIGREVERPTCHCCCCTKKTSIATPYLPYIETVTICDINAESPYIREKADIVLQE